jgi:hypothetical protein
MDCLVIVARNLTSTNRGLLAAVATVGLDALVLPPEQALGDFAPLLPSQH